MKEISSASSKEMEFVQREKATMNQSNNVSIQASGSELQF
jgi:hypothetical protein